ncbi:hypothetical protein C380_10760 [Acidovorax sp. KKS102]|uniref:DUF4406 domain-containing protein n=1 Tax=Acidovorax sp. KKS102 TaxID=358220 RepID=UPI00028A83FA|nr:DUF4406 domain-containing protein [Acidovorax sp. KKS102]AFU45853.1 hypothetical protein C380_10760 [Acidovorax sp. KKS102]
MRIGQHPQPSPTPQADSAPAEAVQRIVHLRTDRERRVYVAGPMTGLPEYNFPLFNATAARLRSEGWHVENPAEHGHVEGAGWADYLRWDISRIATCGAIYLLPGWSKSKGATLEVHIASVLGLQVLLADGAESPTAQPAPAATPTAASLAWNALRDLTGPLGEDGVKIMGHIRTYAQRQYEAGLAEGRAAPAATPQADSQPAPSTWCCTAPHAGCSTSTPRNRQWNLSQAPRNGTIRPTAATCATAAATSGALLMCPPTA